MYNSKRWRSLNDFGAQDFDYNFRVASRNSTRPQVRNDYQRSALAYDRSSYYCDRKYSENYPPPMTRSNQNQSRSRSRHQQQQFQQQQHKRQLRGSVDNLLEVDRNCYKYVDQVSGKLQCSMYCIEDRELVIGLNEMKLPLNLIVLSCLLQFCIRFHNRASALCTDSFSFVC